MLIYFNKYQILEREQYNTEITMRTQPATISVKGSKITNKDKIKIIYQDMVEKSIFIFYFIQE